MLALVLAAHADTVTLDTGATVEGDLARYELGGDCQLTVGEGPLTGAILIVPCHRVASFVRTPSARPVAVQPAIEAESEVAEVVEEPVEEVVEVVEEVLEEEPVPPPRATADEGMISFEQLPPELQAAIREGMRSGAVQTPEPEPQVRGFSHPAAF